MTATILLARHGTHDEVGRVLSGRSDIALNPAGRAEAAALAARLADVRLDTIQSSPRRRARETAQAVAGPRGMAVATVPALDEIDFGSWTGRSFASLAGDPAWDRWNAARGVARCPGGETMTAAVDRAMTHVERLAGTTLLVSHCDIIRGLVTSILGLPLDRLLTLGCDPGSLTRLERHGAGWTLAELNLR